MEMGSVLEFYRDEVLENILSVTDEHGEHLLDVEPYLFAAQMDDVATWVWLQNLRQVGISATARRGLPNQFNLTRRYFSMKSRLPKPLPSKIQEQYFHLSEDMLHSDASEVLKNLLPALLAACKPAPELCRVVYGPRGNAWFPNPATDTFEAFRECLLTAMPRSPARALWAGADDGPCLRIQPGGDLFLTIHDTPLWRWLANKRAEGIVANLEGEDVILSKPAYEWGKALPELVAEPAEPQLRARWFVLEPWLLPWEKEYLAKGLFALFADGNKGTVLDVRQGAPPGTVLTVLRSPQFEGYCVRLRPGPQESDPITSDFVVQLATQGRSSVVLSDAAGDVFAAFYDARRMSVRLSGLWKSVFWPLGLEGVRSVAGTVMHRAQTHGPDTLLRPKHGNTMLILDVEGLDSRDRASLAACLLEELARSLPCPLALRVVWDGTAFGQKLLLRGPRTAAPEPKPGRPRLFLFSGHAEVSEQLRVVPGGCTLVVTSATHSEENGDAFMNLLEAFTLGRHRRFLSQPWTPEAREWLGNLLANRKTPEEPVHVYNQGAVIPNFLFSAGDVSTVSGLLEFPVTGPLELGVRELDNFLTAADIVAMYQHSLSPTLAEVQEACLHDSLALPTPELLMTAMHRPVADIMAEQGPGVYYFGLCQQASPTYPDFGAWNHELSLRQNVALARRNLRTSAVLVAKEELRTMLRSLRRTMETVRAGESPGPSHTLLETVFGAGPHAEDESDTSRMLRAAKRTKQ